MRQWQEIRSVYKENTTPWFILVLLRIYWNQIKNRKSFNSMERLIITVSLQMISFSIAGNECVQLQQVDNLYSKQSSPSIVWDATHACRRCSATTTITCPSSPAVTITTSPVGTIAFEVQSVKSTRLCRWRTRWTRSNAVCSMASLRWCSAGTTATIPTGRRVRKHKGRPLHDCRIHSDNLKPSFPTNVLSCILVNNARVPLQSDKFFRRSLYSDERHWYWLWLLRIE